MLINHKILRNHKKAITASQNYSRKVIKKKMKPPKTKTLKIIELKQAQKLEISFTFQNKKIKIEFKNCVNIQSFCHFHQSFFNYKNAYLK